MRGRATGAGRATSTEMAVVEDAEVEPVEKELVFASDVMRQLVDVTDRVARTDGSVLIVGEPGVGKEVLARRMHARSERRHGPFVAMPCSGFSRKQSDVDLFAPRGGGGTLYLATPSELPPEHQRRLLQLLDEGGELRDPRGDGRPGARVVCGTDVDLLSEVGAGRLCRDLARRLQTVEVRVPPLRERGQDVLLLARHFIRQLGHPGVVGDELAAALRGRRWKHNVRELKEACIRLTAAAPGGELRVENLPPPVERTSKVRSFEEWPPLPEDGLSLVEFEKRLIRRVLSMKRGNITHAAAYLKLPRHVLAYRLDKYGLR